MRLIAKAFRLGSVVWMAMSNGRPLSAEAPMNLPQITFPTGAILLGSGGFSSDKLGHAMAGTFKIGAIKFNIKWLSGESPDWEIEHYNAFDLKLEGSKEEDIANYANGDVTRVACYTRQTSILPRAEAFGVMIDILRKESELELILERFVFEVKRLGYRVDHLNLIISGAEVLEAMMAEGWVTGRVLQNARYLRIVLAHPNPGAYVGWSDERGLLSVHPSHRSEIILPAAQVPPLRKSVPSQ